VVEAGGIITPEEVREIRLRLRAQWRKREPLYDYTFSVPKSVSVLWASLLQAAAEAEAEHREADAKLYTGWAEQIRAAVKRANDRMIKLAEQRLAYVRTGHHSATSGQWRDARLHRRVIPAAHQPRGRPAASRAQRHRQPRAARGRSRWQVARAARAAAVQGEARRRRVRERFLSRR
jgi:TrwC relaxase